MVWKLATFNVNGIRARLSSLLAWIERHQPDVLCLQEIKCQDKDFPLEPLIQSGYSASVRGQKSFNGVAVLTRREPTAIVREFGDGGPDQEARMISVQVDGVWVVNTYVPQGRSPEDPAFQYKLEFLFRLKRWLENQFNPGQPLIWTGDINVAPEEIDVFDPKRLQGEAGFHPAERQALADVMAWGLVDLFRKHHPGEKQFTFWDYRLPKGFQRNLGWRLDHILVTAPLARVSSACQVDSAMRGLEKASDHAPVWAEFALGEL